MQKEIGGYFGAVSILMRTRRVGETGRKVFFFYWRGFSLFDSVPSKTSLEINFICRDMVTPFFFFFATDISLSSTQVPNWVLSFWQGKK